MPEENASSLTPAVKRQKHLGHIDGLRGLAALFVALSHLFGRVWGDGTPHTLTGKLIAKVSPMSHFAVTAFIILSGYCLMLPLLKHSMAFKDGLPNYFARRFLRIAPAFYATFLLSAALATQMYDTGNNPLVSPSHPVTWVHVVAHSLFLHYVIPGGLLPYNGVLWSVGVEWWIYFSLPVLVWLWKRSGNRVIATLLAAAVFYALFYAVRGTIFDGFRFEYFAMFAIGGLCASIAHESPPGGKKNRMWLWIALLTSLTNLGIIWAIGWERGQHYAHLFDLLFGGSFFALLVFLAASPSHIVARICAHRWLTILGSFSYSLYLIHFPLETIFVERILNPLQLSEEPALALLFFVCTPLVCLASYGFYLIVEKPSLRWSQSLKKRAG